MEVTVEVLVAAIRNGASQEELQRMVGPNEDEKEAAKNRMARLDALDSKCEWDSFTPSLGAMLARGRHAPIAKAQGVFESKYC